MMTMMRNFFLVSSIQLLYTKILLVTFLSVRVVPLCKQQQILIHAFRLVTISNVNVHNNVICRTKQQQKQQQQQQPYQYSAATTESKVCTIQFPVYSLSRDDEGEEQEEDNKRIYENNNNINDTDDDDDDENSSIIPYKNRSLYWTENYRKFRPYNIVRASIIKLGIKSQKEWYERVQDGSNCNPYIPTNPDIMYSNDWESWDEFLGVIRSYNDTKNLLQTVLQLKNISHYNNFIQSNTQRAEGLRIPSNPVLYYNTSIGNNTWISYDDFFGTSTTSNTNTML